MLNALASSASFASLHTAYPGLTGTSELAGGVPPYARQSITWNPSSGGNLDNLLNPTFNVPASTISWLGLWTLAVAGNFLGSAPLGSSIPLPFTTDDATDIFYCDQHPFLAGTQVVLFQTEGSVLPGGIVEGTIYFVRDVAVDTFKLAATSGGAAINITTDGAGFVTTILPQTFALQGIFTLQDVDLSLNR